MRSVSPRLKLAATGFLQVVFVAANTVFIGKHHLPAIFATGFAISWLWTSNVKKVAFGGNWDRFAYTAGAAVGSVLGTIAAARVMA